MSNASQRGDRAEERAAKILGVKRVGGKRKRERVPDTEPVRLPSGRLLQPEVKSRKNLPKLLTDALLQARRYAPTAEPVAVFFERGSRRGVVVLDLELFTELVGIRSDRAPAQLALALVVPPDEKKGKKSDRGPVD